MVKFLEGQYEELNVYVRHSAWLNAVPEKPEGDKSKEPEKSRRETLGDTIEMPPCDCGYLVGYLFEVGPTMGESPVTHTEIANWQRNTGIELNSWEA